MEQVLEQSQSILKLAPAFVKAQCEICGATKDKKNPHFNSKYADLSSVMDACKESLNKHGIAIIQTPAPCEAGRLGLTTKLLHESGEWISGTGNIPIDRAGPQAYGSALTYARRYFLAAMVGVCPEDDDAGAATGRGSAPRQEQRPAPPERTAAPPNGKPAAPVTPAVKPPRTTEITDEEQFLITLTEAFDARDWPETDRENLLRASLDKAGVTRLPELSFSQRGKLINAIASGKVKHNGAPKDDLNMATVL